MGGRIMIDERTEQWRMPHSAWIRACRESEHNRVSKSPEDERAIVDALVSAGRGSDGMSTPPAAVQAVDSLRAALDCARRAVHYEVRGDGRGLRATAIDYAEQAIAQLRQAMSDEQG